MPTHEILRLLRLLAPLSRPLWLTGGVGVDFLVGRWTRPHKDVDVIALTPDRLVLAAELDELGFVLMHDGGWTTRWRPPEAPTVSPKLEIIFLQPAEPETAALVVEPRDRSGAAAGRYPLPPYALAASRTATLEGVTFRLASAESEWLSRKLGTSLVPGRVAEPKILHDLALLEALVTPERQAQLLASQGTT